jgi:hypothetical protein
MRDHIALAVMNETHASMDNVDDLRAGRTRMMDASEIDAYLCGLTHLRRQPSAVIRTSFGTAQHYESLRNRPQPQQPQPPSQPPRRPTVTPVETLGRENEIREYIEIREDEAQRIARDRNEWLSNDQIAAILRFMQQAYPGRVSLIPAIPST